MTGPLTERYPASCRLGYTEADLEHHFGAKTGEPHPLWTQLNGQTGAICTGKDCDEAHGHISYIRDVLEWAKGRPASDW